MIAYLFMVIAVMAVADRSIRSSDLVRAGPALAASAGTFAYGVAGFLFDELFFPQAPYLFFFAAATVVILASPQVSSRRVGVGRRADEGSCPVQAHDQEPASRTPRQSLTKHGD